jgi:tetratricopeptide (TPR) repeat protein
MRARLGLAQLLYEAGEREEAIAEYRSMLELNSRDNQGVRYLLLSAYLETGTDAADAEAMALVERMRDASSAWAYAKDVPH